MNNIKVLQPGPLRQWGALLTVFVVILLGILVFGKRKKTDVRPKPKAASAIIPKPVEVLPESSKMRNILDSLSSSRMLEHVRRLSQQPRLVGSPNERNAADYIEGQFKDFGYTPKRQWFTNIKGLRTCNIMTRIAVLGAPRLIVGAHYDSVKNAPGANDNASGVAVLLELAQVLHDRNLAFDVTFVAFGSEEVSRDGSKYYVKNLDKSHWPRGMINMDMVGVGEVFQIGLWGNPDDWLVKHCGQASDRWDGEAVYPSEFGGKSDYAAFAKAGIPVACMAWDEDPNYHTPHDSLAYIDEKSFAHRMSETARVIAAALLTPEGGFGNTNEPR